jgi:tetratricopeptide (TPR) repeat protein
MNQPRGAVWVWCLLVTLASPASAQRGRPRHSVPAPDTAASAPSVDPREAEARSLFEAGRRAFTDGRFEDALERFRQSYELSGRAELLFNIGQAADRLRRDRDALAAFEQYLAALPRATNRREVESRILVLRAARTAPEVPTAIVVSRAAEDVDAVPSPAAPIHEHWWFWSILGGAVAVVAGVSIGVAVGSGEVVDGPAVTGDVGPGGIVIALEGP